METQVGEGRDGNTQIMCTRVEKGQVREGCLQIKPTIAPVSGENAIHECMGAEININSTS